jgi:uncharacterized protein involved in exopolysaccharide biosynthesis
MHKQQDTTQLRDVLAAIWRRRLVAAAVFVICLVVAVGYAYSQPKRYESEATIAFMPTTHQGQFANAESISELLATYAVIAQSEQNLDAAAELLGHPLTGSVGTSTAAGSWVLGVISEAPTPDDAAETAKAASDALVTEVRSSKAVVPTIITQPSASSVPVQPRPKLILLVAVVLGLIASVLISLLVDNLLIPASKSSPLDTPGPTRSTSAPDLTAAEPPDLAAAEHAT